MEEYEHKNSRPLKGKKVLIVEDDLLQAIDLGHSLEEAGCSVTGPIPDLDEARRIMADGAIDAVVLDLRVGNRNASAFAHHLLQSDTPVVVLSGYPDSLHLSSQSKRCKFIQKPAAPAEVVRILGELLRSCGAD